MRANTLVACTLCAKIARLVQERGWNQDEFARSADLNRLTVRHIFQGGRRRLHNATVAACARALGLTVGELRDWPVERLISRMRSQPGEADAQRQLFDQATQPELMAWFERNPERAAKLTPQETEELLSLQGTGGPLTKFGVAHFVELMERRRRLLEKVAAVAGTEYIDFLEKLVELLYEKIQPYKDRGVPGQTI
ncbi:MAG: helix-turn-helix transcriptional regulator [Planctomycetes bacterium]|nr:helix-turn-helix transcriptional regulator [Planctomycetota bacterium]